MNRSTLEPLLVTGRLERIRELIEPGVHYITKPANIRWLCGFEGSNGQLLLGADRAVLLTDSRYDIQAARQMEIAGAEGFTIKVLSGGEGPAVVADEFNDGPLWVEGDHLSVRAFRELSKAWPDEVHEVARDAVAEARQTKDAAELARMQLAAAVADEALTRTLPMLASGTTEAAFAAHFDYQVRLLGADGVAFDTIVASGPNSVLPHAKPGPRVIQPGDLVVIDCGARFDGYRSDMTRTVVAGGKPTLAQREQYDAVLAAQQAGVAAVRAGVDAARIDEVCRDVLADAGFADAYSHGTGHGIGLDIHEQPILSSRATATLGVSWVITVEPGAYLEGRGGIRVEDSVIVSADGAQPITASPFGLEPWA